MEGTGQSPFKEESSVLPNLSWWEGVAEPWKQFYVSQKHLHPPAFAMNFLGLGFLITKLRSLVFVFDFFYLDKVNPATQ